MVHQIALGMAALHKFGVVHRDLATRNVLLFENLVVKVTDFGLSRAVQPDKEYYRLTTVNRPMVLLSSCFFFAFLHLIMYICRYFFLFFNMLHLYWKKLDGERKH